MKPIFFDAIYLIGRYMLDAVSLDQLRTFIAAADEGSFSAAGRKLRRAQSVVSHTLANLEGQLGVRLFDRTGRYPRLTEAGAALLIQARTVVSGMDGFKSKARAMAEGLEPELSVVVDVMYPMSSLTDAVGAFRKAFPHTPLRLYVEALGAVMQPVIEQTCRIGISGSMPVIPDLMEAEKLLDVPMVTVAAPSHPLASRDGLIQPRELKEHVQLVLTDRTALTDGTTFGVFLRKHGGLRTLVQSTRSCAPDSGGGTCRWRWCRLTWMPARLSGCGWRPSKFARRQSRCSRFTERTRRLARQAGGFSNGSWNRVSQPPCRYGPRL